MEAPSLFTLCHHPDAFLCFRKLMSGLEGNVRAIYARPMELLHPICDIEGPDVLTRKYH